MMSIMLEDDAGFGEVSDLILNSLTSHSLKKPLPPTPTIVGFTCGAFDLLHAGHIAMLAEAKQNCNYLIVGLHTDPSIDRKEKNKPAQSTFERFMQLYGCKFVDEIMPYDTEQDLYNLLCVSNIDIRFLDEHYRDKSFTGDNLCYCLDDDQTRFPIVKSPNNPIQVHFTPRKHTFSSSNMRKKIQESNTTAHHLGKEK